MSLDRNPFDAVRDAVREAENLNRAVDNQSNALAELLRGRLRTVTPYHLATLKRELQQFNAHTGIWKEDR